MGLNLTGKISLGGSTVGESVNLELGFGATSTISLGQTSVRNLFGKSSGAISLFDGRGKSSVTKLTIASNSTNLDLRSWAISNGWDGSAALEVTVGSDVYIYATTTSSPALTISGSFPSGVSLVNNGFIMGKGGASGAVGGNAIALGVNCTINNTNPAAYIGGGGGGGGSTQGGGGAGGGNGSPSPGTSGASGASGVGGGGGLIFPGTGGASQSTTGSIGGAGGGAGGSGGISVSSRGTGTHSVQIGTYCRYSSTAYDWVIGGGGGGWGASGAYTASFSSTVSGSNQVSGAGGSGNSAGSSGNRTSVYANGFAGGKAIALNGFSVTWVSADTARVYGAVS